MANFFRTPYEVYVGIHGEYDPESGAPNRRVPYSVWFDERKWHYLKALHPEIETIDGNFVSAKDRHIFFLWLDTAHPGGTDGTKNIPA